MGPDPVTEKPMVIKEGRFGPYVTDGEFNASLRRGQTPEELTVEQASEMLAEKRAKGPAPKKKAAAKKAAPAKKATAAKKTDRRQEGSGEEGRRGQEGDRRPRRPPRRRRPHRQEGRRGEEGRACGRPTASAE